MTTFNKPSDTQQPPKHTIHERKPKEKANSPPVGE